MCSTIVIGVLLGGALACIGVFLRSKQKARSKPRAILYMSDVLSFIEQCSHNVEVGFSLGAVLINKSEICKSAAYAELRTRLNPLSCFAVVITKIDDSGKVIEILDMLECVQLEESLLQIFDDNKGVIVIKKES